jgi:NADPH:quinone reductase-like Zn-dependent oxidoreductase
MAPMKHRRIVVARRGGPDALGVVTEALPAPAPGEVRVKVEAAGISGLDIMLRSRRFPGFPKVPFTPGVDVVGIIDAVGDEVKDLAVGQRIAALLGFNGGYAEHVCVVAKDAVAISEDLDAAEAVTMVANYLTAHLAMHPIARVADCERVLVHGGAGGVGTALLQLGALCGLERYATASKHNLELVSTLGAVPIDYRNEDFVARIRSLTDGGADVVFDPIGGARQLWRSSRALRRGGRLVWFGVAGSKRHGARVIPASLLMRGALGVLPDGRKAMTTPDVLKDNERYRRILGHLMGLLAAGKVTPVIAARIPLLEAARAHKLIESGRYAGKVVLVTDA